jgi:hypothetical protein
MNIAGELFEVKDRMEEYEKSSRNMEAKVQSWSNSLDLATETDGQVS